MPPDEAGSVPGLPGMYVHQVKCSSSEDVHQAVPSPQAQPTPQPAAKRVIRRSSHHQKLRRSVRSRKSLAGAALQALLRLMLLHACPGPLQGTKTLDAV